MGKFFLNFYYLIQKRKSASKIALVIIFGILVWMASNITFDEDISKLIPSNSENEQLQKVLKTVQFADKIIVHIERQNDGSTDDLTDYATRFLDSLAAHSNPFILDIQGKIEDETIFETLNFVYNHAPLFLKEADYKNISNKLFKYYKLQIK